MPGNNALLSIGVLTHWCCARQTGFGGVPGLQWTGFVVVPCTGDFAGTQEDGNKVPACTLH